MKQHESGNAKQNVARHLEAIHQKIIAGEMAEAIDEPLDENSPDLAGAKRMLELLELARRQEQLDQRETVRDELAQTDHDIPAASPWDRLDVTGLQDELDEPVRLGHFEIVSQLGRGGYGLVFLGRDPELDRSVALKVPRPEAVMTDELVTRFMREAKAAAALSHPNIVPVFEAGRAGPICYIASEYVEGKSLADWIANQGGPIDSRKAAQLVATLADAVAHAHQRGVLHRDLKPGNVLLADQSPKITDFGLAKLLEDSTQQTQTSAIVGTPAYMSPEQAKGARDHGPATDVYALGVILYELITGQVPFHGDSILETLRAVQEREPTPPRRIVRTVPADLEAICLKCLEKQPYNRYVSANALNRDLNRFLAGEPVQARKISAASRLTKWIKRNRLAAAVLVILLAGIVGTSVGLVRARIAESEARIEATTASEVSDFLVNLFNVSSSDNKELRDKPGRLLTAEELLKEGVTKIREDLSDQPEIQARLMHTIGKVCNNLAIYDEAESLLRDALRIRQEILAPRDADLALTHIDLCAVLRKLDRLDEATDEIDRAIEILEHDPKSNHDVLSKSLNEKGLLLRRSDPSAAISAYQQARQLISTYQDPQHESLWQIDANIASIHARVGNYEQAVEGLKRALDGGQRVLGENHPRLGPLLGNIAYVYRQLGDYGQARLYQSLDVALLQEHLDPNHPDLGVALLNLASSDKRSGDLQAAIENGRQSIEIFVAKLPVTHDNRWKGHRNFAETLSRVGEYAQAREQIQLARSCLEMRTDPKAKFNDLYNQVMLSRIERFDNNPDLALQIIDASLTEPDIHDNSALLTDALFERALILAQLGREDAREALEAANQNAKKSEMRTANQAYTEARFWCLVDDAHAAMDRLQAAYDAGFRDAIIATDPDFQLLQKDGRFQQLLNRIAVAVGSAEAQ